MWNDMWLIRFFKYGPKMLVWIVVKLMTWIFLNRFVLWFGGGVPCKQYRLIQKDGIPMAQYLARTFDGERALQSFLKLIGCLSRT